MALFKLGRKNYSEAVHNISGDELKQFHELYKMKYWGLVDAHQWQANEQAALNDNGEIKACYQTEDGTDVYLVRLADCSQLFFVAKSELDDGYIQRQIEWAEEQRRQLQEAMERERERIGRPRQRPQTTASQEGLTIGTMYAYGGAGRSNIPRPRNIVERTESADGTVAYTSRTVFE